MTIKASSPGLSREAALVRLAGPGGSGRQSGAVNDHRLNEPLLTTSRRLVYREAASIRQLIATVEVRAEWFSYVQPWLVVYAFRTTIGESAAEGRRRP